MNAKNQARDRAIDTTTDLTGADCADFVERCTTHIAELARLYQIEELYQATIEREEATERAA